MFRFIRLAGVASFCVYRTTFYKKLQLLYDKNTVFFSKIHGFHHPKRTKHFIRASYRPGKLSLFKRLAM